MWADWNQICILVIYESFKIHNVITAFWLILCTMICGAIHSTGEEKVQSEGGTKSSGL